MEAGANFSWAFFSHMISPVDASINIALFAFFARSTSSAFTTVITEKNIIKSINFIFSFMLYPPSKIYALIFDLLLFYGYGVFGI